MEILLIIFGALVIIGLFFVLLEIKKKSTSDKNHDLLLETLHNELKEIRGEVKGSLEKNIDFLQKQAGQSSRLIQEITEKLTKLDDTNKQVIGFTEQLQSLQDILKNPKQRGILGEFYLESLLKNVLPPGAYDMQYKFKDGDIVDAVIFVKDKIIPIDSKFSLENYNKIVKEKDPAEREKLEKLFKQDLKNRIDETAKYIKPKEGTMDFAFMFIPSEAIYYDLLINQIGAVKVSTRDLIEYAFRDKHVIIVSPTSFFAYLQTVLQGLRALQIEESAKEIRKRVEQLSKHLMNYDEYMKKLGNHLGTAVNTYNTAYREFGKVDKDVAKLTGGETQVEPLVLDKPDVDERE